MALRTDYQDFVANAAGKKYRIVDVGDGLVSIQDATNYDQIGDSFSAGVINATNAQVNANTEAIANMSPDEIGAIPTTEKGAANGVATLNVNGKVEAQQAQSIIKNATADLTLSLDDAGCFIYSTASSATTITIPPDSDVGFPVGTEIEILRGNASVTIQADPDVGIRFVGSAFTKGQSCIIPQQFGIACIKKLATNFWIVSGAVV